MKNFELKVIKFQNPLLVTIHFYLHLRSWTGVVLSLFKKQQTVQLLPKFKGRNYRLQFRPCKDSIFKALLTI